IQRLCFITGFSLKHLPVTYLGASLYKGNKKSNLFHDLIDKMRNQLQGWEKSSLSHGGRLALIKSSLSTIPIFLIQVLQPPKSILHTIEQIMARFFWGTIEIIDGCIGLRGKIFVILLRKGDWGSDA
ncbi:hypothetical protein Pfo_019819, partial [Paulownia fortunei]